MNMTSIFHIQRKQVAFEFWFWTQVVVTELVVSPRRRFQFPCSAAREYAGDAHQWMLGDIRIGAGGMWGFPKIGVPLNHPSLDGIFPNKNHPYWGTPIMETPTWGMSRHEWRDMSWFSLKRPMEQYDQPRKILKWDWVLSYTTGFGDASHRVWSPTGLSKMV